MTKKAARKFESLRGQILVALPCLVDSNFSDTAVLVTNHTQEGAFGLVLNRPFLGLTEAKVFAKVGIAGNLESLEERQLLSGGPVGLGRGFVLHTDESVFASTMEKGLSGMNLSAGRDVLEAIAAGHGPERYEFFLGYSGWGAGQLEAEIAAGDWLCIDNASDLVLCTGPENILDAVLARKGLSSVILKAMTGETAHA